MKTIYLVTRLIKVGPTNQAYNLTTALKALKHDVTLVCLSPENPSNSWESRFIEAGIPIFRIDRKPYDIIGCVRDLKRYIWENKIDIVHSSGFRADLINVLLGDIVKHVTTQRNEYDETGEGRNYNKYLLKKIVIWMAKKMDVRIACSKSLAEITLNKYTIPYEVVQNSVDVDKFSKLSKEDKLIRRKELSLPLDGTLYIYHGILAERKNINFLLAIFEKLDKDQRLVIVGGASHEINKLKEVAPDNVIFVGFKSSPAEYLQCADYSISASTSEGLPNSVLESLATGIPPILSDISQHIEILALADIGESFVNNDIKSALNAIAHVKAKDYELLTENCIKLAHGTFSKYHMAQKYISFYNKALNS